MTLLPSVLFALFSSMLVSVALAEGPADLSSLKADDAVSVREGDTWSAATFEKKEGRKYQIKLRRRHRGMGDRRPLEGRPRRRGGTSSTPTTPTPTTPAPASPGPTKPKVASYPTGSTVEAKDNAFWNPAKVINRRGDWYLLEWTKFRRHREWVEPWRIRKPGSDYDLKGWYTNPRVENGRRPAARHARRPDRPPRPAR